MTQYAQIETKSAPLSSDFARDFMTRRWGAEFTAAVLERMPRYQRGPKKGTVKGRLFWTKCTRGGWQRTGPSYHGSPQGRVVTPGSGNLRIALGYDDTSGAMNPGDWPEYPTFEQKLERLQRSIDDMVAAEKRSRRGW